VYVMVLTVVTSLNDFRGRNCRICLKKFEFFFQKLEQISTSHKITDAIICFLMLLMKERGFKM
jgi:hypothetical protein